MGINRKYTKTLLKDSPTLTIMTFFVLSKPSVLNSGIIAKLLDATRNCGESIIFVIIETMDGRQNLMVIRVDEMSKTLFSCVHKSNF